MADALFDKYGGFKFVSRIVLSFYDKVLDSDQVGDHFDGIDMPRLIDHQTKFIASLLGGPISYSDERLKRAHASLNLTHDDFDEVRRLLSETLADHGIEPQDVETVMAEIEARRSSILSDDAS
ncbi:MAG: group 1 truncated hemoglobin [Roseibium sp.]|uniref:group I truncated hemoglobin n=1 Tax=Roseibium sp. TaxID=1936156 RepID=UPI002612ECED|nr:group 1 truncated hemoglobin [Roseibium sp.]MCV0426505.1 group 1 truncated hemoglobin [Roseibium sp.]